MTGPAPVVPVRTHLTVGTAEQLALMVEHYGRSEGELIERAVANLAEMAMSRAGDWFRVSQDHGMHLRLVRGHAAVADRRRS